METLTSHNLTSSETSKLEEVAVKAAVSSGADVVLVQDQLGANSSLSFAETYSETQLAQLIDLSKPFFQVE
jgi:hypothetical protein